MLCLASEFPLSFLFLFLSFSITNATELNPTHQVKNFIFFFKKKKKLKKNQIPPLLLPLPHPLPPSLVLRPPLLPLRHHRLRHQFRSPLNPPQRNGIEHSRLAMFGHSALFGRRGCDVD